MRKGISLLTVLLLVLVVLPTAAFAHTESDPFVTPLVAGQNMTVGEVQVWNDPSTLHVTYVITDPGWCLMETHLHVAGVPEDIPQRNGNPVPGQFDHKGEHECGMQVTYDIPWTGMVGDPLYIAAHAVVADVETVNATTSWYHWFFSVPGMPVYGPLGHYAMPEAADWTGLSVPGGAVAVVPHTSWMTPPAPAVWISTAEYVEDPVNDSWRWFHYEYPTPEGAVMCRIQFDGVTSDNAEEVYFNGGLVGSDGEVSGDFVDNHEWATFWPDETGFTYQTGFTDILPDTLTADFIVRNYALAGGTIYSNPTGLLFKGYFGCKIAVEPETETAWGEGMDFPGRNWAMYFMYEWQ